MSLILHTEDLDVEDYQVGGDGDAPEFQATPCDPEENTEDQPAEATNEQPEQAIEHPGTERISDDEDFRIRIWNAEMRCRGKEAIVEDLKEQLKSAKSDYEGAVEALRKLANEGYSPMPLFDARRQEQPAAEPIEDADCSVDDDWPEENEAWREKDFIELIKASKIEGLGKKKLEALAEVVKTFGDFEDLRTKASLENIHLSKLLPAGFGEKVTDQIEECFLVAAVNSCVYGEQDDGPVTTPGDADTVYEDADLESL